MSLQNNTIIYLSLLDTSSLYSRKTLRAVIVEYASFSKQQLPNERPTERNAQANWVFQQASQLSFIDILYSDLSLIRQATQFHNDNSLQILPWKMDAQPVTIFTLSSKRALNICLS
jgi:hypothetical protein